MPEPPTPNHEAVRLAHSVCCWLVCNRPDLQAGDARKLIVAVFGPAVDAALADQLARFN